MTKQIREIRVKDLISYFYLPLATILLLIAGFILSMIFIGPVWLKWSLVPLFLAAAYFIAKRLGIGCVLMYKAYAPMDTRNRCRFEPSCSTYMILAIKKYGLFRGVIKGIKRVRRCKPPNGGIDYP